MFSPARLVAIASVLVLAVAPVLLDIATVQRVEAQSGLVAAYSFDAGSGTTAADASGNELTATLNAATTWTSAGRFGSALSFNGTTARVTVADHPLLDLTTGVTLQAWVYPTSLSGFRTVILKERPGELAYALYGHDGARPAAWITAGSIDSVRGTASLPLNTWTHLATTYDGTSLRLFVNGVQVSTRAHAGALFVSGNPLRIGGNAIWGEYFQGRIDEVRIYGRVLSASEIQTDMTTPIGPVADTTPPAVAVTSPAPNATVSGTISLTATASDNVSVAGVQFMIDGMPAGAEDTSAPYSVSLDTAALSNASHQVTARARDTAGNSTTSSPAVPITVFNAPPNQAPVARAGADFTSFVAQSAQLDGSASTDPDGDALTYSWTFASLPAGSTATLSNSAAANPTFIVDRSGTYVVRLVVNDGAVDSAPDTVTIVTENRVPVANAGPDQTAAVMETVTLNASGSSDLDGDPLTYSWRFQSLPPGSQAALSSASAVNPTFVIDAFGTYVLHLTVNDGTVDSAPDAIAISTVNSRPAAHAGPDQTVFVAQTVTLDGSRSSDVDGNVLTFSWSFVDRPASSAAVLGNAGAVNPTFVVDAAGTYTVQLVVNDGSADSAPATVMIRTQNSAPVANAGPDASVFVTDIVRLDGSGSTDVDGDPLTYAWSLATVPAGSTASLDTPSAVTPTFVVDRPGIYVAQLIVRDGHLAAATDTVTITTDNSAPVADAGSDQTAIAGRLVQLDGTQSRDVDRDVLAFEWSLTARPEGSAAFLANSTSAGPSFTVDRPGTYVVQLIVNDGMVDSAPDTTTINTTNSAPAAHAGPDQADVAVGAVVSLDGTQSSDPDGHPITYSWSLIAKPSSSSAVVDAPTAANPTFTTDAAGDYVAQLIVDDGFASSPPDTVLIHANSPPSANAGPDQSVHVGDTVRLDAGLSSDAEGHPIGYSWQFLAIPLGSTATLQDATTANAGFVADAAGTYHVRLTVADSLGAMGTDSVAIAATVPPGIAIAPGSLTFPDTLVGRQSSSQTLSVTNPTALTVTISSVVTSGDFVSSSGCDVLPPGERCTIDILFSPAAPGARSGRVTVTSTAPGSPNAIDLSGRGVAAPVVTVAVSDPDAAEAASETGGFLVNRTGDLTGPLLVNYTIDGSATNGTDYIATDGSVTIGAGQASATLIVTPVDDGLFEQNETVVVTLTGGAAYDVGTSNSATVTIADNDATAVTVAATDASAAEVGPDPGTFTITRTGPTPAALEVFFTVGGTATATSDYQNTVGTTATIPAGAASVTRTVTPVNDALVEGDETVLITLTADAAYTIGAPNSATMTIADSAPTVTVAATDAAASEVGPDPGTFTFTRTGSTTATLRVNFIRSGTATAGSSNDYTGISTFVDIPAGQASVTRTVAPILDARLEGNETVIVTLSAGSYNIGAANSATVTIADNVPTVTVVATDAAASEAGPDPGTFTFTRTGPTGVALRVNITRTGTATRGSAADYTGVNTPIDIPVGQASVTRSVTPNVDGLAEGNETVIVTLTSGAYTIGAASAATVTIADDPPTVTVVAADASADEAGPDPGTFTISRTGLTTAALQVLFTVNGTATPAADYANTIGTSVTIPIGQASATRTVTPVLDGLVEANETVTLTLTQSNYIIGAASTATVTIAENTPTVTVVATDAAADEAGPDAGTFTFTRTGPTAAALRVNFTRTGTATFVSASDYTGVGTFVDIPAGQASVTATVIPVPDALIESNETVVLTLAAGTYVIGAARTATVVIAENTPTVIVTETDAAASEIGPDPGSFTFTRTGPTVVDLRVYFDRSGTATAGADYSDLGAFVDIPAGQVSTTVTVMPNMDAPNVSAFLEGQETVVVALAAGQYLIGTPAAATVNISDSADWVSVTATAPMASEIDETPGRFTFTRTGSIDVPLRVNFAVSGTATLGDLADYAFNGSSTFVDIPAGQQSVDATVTPRLDTLLEGDETIVVTLTAGLYAIGVPAATVTIADDAATIVASDPNGTEQGGDTVTFTIIRHGSTADDRVVEVTFTGTATLDSDYSIDGEAIIGAAGNVRRVRIPTGEASATLTITPHDDAELEEAEHVVATAEGMRAEAMIVANDSTSITLTLVDTYVIGVGQAVTLQVSREQPAPPGGVNVTVTSDDPGIVAVGELGTTTILEHAYTGQITLNGVAVGSTIIRGIAAGHEEAALGVEVTVNAINAPATVNVRPSEMAMLPITIGPGPAPAGGRVVDVVSASPRFVQVATPQVTIPAGAFSANAAVRGVAAGSSYVTVSSPGYVSSTTLVTRTAEIVDTPFSFANGFPAPLFAVQLESSGTPIGAPAQVTVDLSSGDPGCLTVPPSVTVLVGFVVATFQPTYGGAASLPCTTTVTASSAGLDSDSASVTVNPPGISMPEEVTVGSGLQTHTAAKLGDAQHGGVTVTVSSSDPALVRVSSDATTPGTASVTLTIPVGETSVSYYVQGMENTTGSAIVTVTPSAAFPAGTHVVSVVPSGIEIVDLSATRATLSANDDALYVRVGVANANGAGLDGVQMVRAGGPPFVVTLTNSNASVARLVSDEPAATGQLVTKPIPPGYFHTQAVASGTIFGLALDPLAAGSTVVTATGPPGVVTTALGARTVTVTESIEVAAPLTLGSGLQLATAATLNGPAHGGVSVTITSNDPARVLVSPDPATPGTAAITVAIPDGQTTVPYYVQGMEGTTGSATVTVAPSAGSPSAIQHVTVVRAGVEIAALDATTTTLSRSDTDWSVQVGTPLPGNTALGSLQSVRAGGPPFVVTLSNSNAAVAQLTSDDPPAQAQLVMKPIRAGSTSTQAAGGDSSFGLGFDPLTNGTTVVTVTGPPDVATMSATGVRTVSVSASAISLPAAFLVGAGLQSGTAAALDGAGHGGVGVTITSAAPYLVRVSPNAITPGTASITVNVDQGQTSIPFFIQGMENVAGTTTITLSAPGFIATQAAITVTPIAVQIGGLDPVMTAGAAGDADWWVEVGVPNVDNSALGNIQMLRAGGPAFLVTVISSTEVARLRSDEPAATGQIVTKQIQPGVYYTQAVIAGTAYGLAFDPLVSGSTVVTVTGPPGVATTGLGVRTINVMPESE